MNNFTQDVQAKCLAFGDRVIKLNDYLLSKAANGKPWSQSLELVRSFPKGLENAESISAIRQLLEQRTPKMLASIWLSRDRSQRS